MTVCPSCALGIWAQKNRRAFLPLPWLLGFRDHSYVYAWFTLEVKHMSLPVKAIPMSRTHFLARL